MKFYKNVIIKASFFSLLFKVKIPDSVNHRGMYRSVSQTLLFFDNSQDTTVVVITVFFAQKCENVQ